MTDQATVPSEHGQNRAALLLGLTWTEAAFSFVCIGLRFYCRKNITKNLWWDDWCILITFVFSVISLSMFTVYASNGGTRHVFELQPAQISRVTELNYVSQAFCIMAISTGKLSVALLIYRLQAPCRWRTWVLAILSITSLVFAILVIALFFAQCSPTKALWLPHTGTCWNPKSVNAWDITASSYWALVDFLLATLPITFLWKLKLDLKKRVLLSALLGLGVFASICAAVKASYLPTLTAKADITWITVSLLIWNSNEVNVIIYAACLPTLMPIFQYCSEVISRWTISGPPPHNSNNSNKAIRLGSLDGESSRPIRNFSSLPSEDGRIESVGHCNKTHTLESKFAGHSEEV